MEVHEERLRDVRQGRRTSEALRRHNPTILEAVEELCGRSPWRRAVRQAAALFASTLGLDRPDAVRVRITVAARALDDVRGAGTDEAHRELRALGEDRPLYVLVCDELTGHRPTGTRRTGEERDTVTRALYLVARMVSSQEQVDELEEMLETGAPRDPSR